jgi:putative transposase
MEEQSVRKTYKCRLYPTPDQQQALETDLWRCRTLYNAALEEHKTAGECHHISLNYDEQKAELPDLKRACPEYTEVHAHVLQDVILRLDRAFQAFFRRVKADEEPGYPRFQGRNRYHSFTYPDYGNGAVLDGGVLALSKIGRIPIRLHRPVQGTPTAVAIIREADGWYACIACAEVPTAPLPPTGREIGIDVGVRVLLVTADGVVVQNPRYYRKAERYLAKCQHRVAQRQQGSHRRRKAAKLLAKAHQTVRRQRTDFHHKTALALVRQFDAIYLEDLVEDLVEDLQVQNMTRRPAPKPDGNGGYLSNGAAAKAGLNKSIHDAGWYAFRMIFACKAAWAGKRVEVVPPAYTPRDCSIVPNVLADGTICGELVTKSLSVRTHVCPRCGCIVDRDENAARNFQRVGQALRGLAGMPVGVIREASSLSGWGACHGGA